MTVKAAIITEIIAPYRIPVFNSLANDTRLDVEILFLSQSEPRRLWRVPLDQIRFRYRVLPGFIIGRIYQGGPLFLNPTMPWVLQRGGFQVIVCGGYHQPSALLALAQARLMGKRCVLWSESTLRDPRWHHPIKERLKSWVARQFHGGVAVGKAQMDYLEFLGISGDKIWLAPDAVDSDFFALRASEIRARRAELRDRFGLRGTVFLYVGRLLDSKGIPELMEAFQKVSEKVDATLLLVGHGPDMERYRSAGNSDGLARIRFEGHKLQEELPLYYALADVFVFPTRGDAWGLVLNEAMAAGLPVIASSAAGAARELIEEGENGFIVPPRDSELLTESMLHLARNPALRDSMCANSRQRIRSFSPERMAAGLADAILNLAPREPAAGAA